MKEHGILFKAEMVKAILNTKPDVWPAEPIDPTKPYKCQTRRLVKINHRPIADVCHGEPEFIGFNSDGSAQFRDRLGLLIPIKPPYGAAGDSLWVKETSKLFSISGIDGSETNPEIWTIKYKATPGLKSVPKQIKPWGRFDKWTPSIHVPRWASRIDSEIKAVRIERLQDISDSDVIAEGAAIRWPGPGTEPYPRNLSECYGILWDSINPKTLWKTNPYVWVYKFTRVAL